MKAQIPAKPWLRQALLVACVASLLSACATAPVYRPKASDDGIGYSDEPLGGGHYRVSFSGDAETTRAQVEDYLLRRAAEIAVRAGYDYFLLDNRSLEADTNFYRSPETWNPETGLVSGLGRRYPGRSEHFAKFSVPAYWSQSEAIPITRYTARSELILLTQDQLATRPGALAAREILKNLAPEVLAGPSAASVAAAPAGSANP